MSQLMNLAIRDLLRCADRRTVEAHRCLDTHVPVRNRRLCNHILEVRCTDARQVHVTCDHLPKVVDTVVDVVAGDERTTSLERCSISFVRTSA